MKLFKHFLKVSILVLLAISCTKDDTSGPTENIQKEYKLIKTNFAELSKKEEFIRTLPLLSRYHSAKSGFLKKSPLEDANGFIIDSTQINKISTKGYTSYTFAILRDEFDDNSFENLLVEIIDGKEEPRASVIKYKYNKDSDGLAVAETYFVDYKTGARMGLGDCYVLTFVTEKQCPCAGHWPGQSCSCQSGPSSSTSHMFICSSSGNGGGGGGGGYINYPSNPIPVRGPAPGTSVPNTVPVHGDNVNVGRRLFLASLSPEQRTWLAGKRPEAVYSSIFNFLISNNFSTPSTLFAKEAIDAMMRGGEVDFTYRIIKDPTFENNPCLNTIYDEFNNSSTSFNYFINQFDNKLSMIDVTLSAGNFPTSNQLHAQTTVLSNNLIDIKFNIDELNRPKLSIARTMIHEFIHALIFKRLLEMSSMEGNVLLSLSPAEVVRMKDNYFELWENYTKYQLGIPTNGIVSDFQHQYMAGKYRTVMATALMQYDNNAHPQSFYDALAWEGLMGGGPGQSINDQTGLYTDSTVAWLAVPLASRLAIITTIRTFNNSNPTNPCN